MGRIMNQCGGCYSPFSDMVVFSGMGAPFPFKGKVGMGMGLRLD